MVYEKYIKKRGKVYGPYLYENKRVNGKVVTSYLGSVDSGDKFRGLNKTFIIGSLAVILLLFFVFYSFSFTGRVSLDVKSDYKAGEQLSGKLRLNIKEGELIPKDSKVLVSLGDIAKEFSLSELVDMGVVSGEFFLENFDISGNGEGYGVAGERIVYSLVDFDLRVFGVGKEKGEGDGNEEVDEKGEIVINETVELEEKDIGKGEKGEVEEEKKETGEIKEKGEGEKEDEVKVGENIAESAGQGEVGADSNSGGSDASQNNVEESASLSSESVSSETSSAANSDNSAGFAEGESAITGSVVSESKFIVSGTASKGEDFSYNLEEGQDAEIVSGSVKVNGSEIGDNNVKLKISDRRAEVSTDYSIVEKGFGEAYLGDNELKLEIDISKFGLIANDSTILNIRLVFDKKTLIEVEEDISVEKSEKEEIEEILNESEDNESLVIVNETNITVEEKFSNLSLIKNIPDIRIAKNSSFNFNLSEYFAGAEGYEFNVSGLNAVFDGEVVNIIAEEGFSGMRKAKVIAYSGNEKIEGNEFRVLVSSGAISISKSRKKVVVGEPVEWRMNVSLSEFENVSIELPVGAESISVRKIVDGIEEESRDSVITGMISAELELSRESGFIKWFKGLFGGRLTGRVVNEVVNETNLANDIIQVELKDEAKEYIIEYSTKGPEAREEEIKRGKRVIISGDDIYNYTDVIASSNLDNRIPIDKVSKIKVYWNKADSESFIVKDVDEIENESIMEKIDSTEFAEEIEELEEKEENKTDVLGDGKIIVSETEDVVNESNIESMGNESIENVGESAEEGIVNNDVRAVNEIVVRSENESDMEINNNSSFSITGAVISEINNGDNNESEINESDVLSETNDIDGNVAISSNSGKQEIPFDAYDLDEDGFIDYIEWVVPHLSEQRFDIIYITRAEHLDDNRTFIEDVFELVKARDNNWTEPIPSGDYLRVMFERNLTSSNDITIYARAGCADNSTVLINGINVPCDIYKKKLRIEELRRLG